MTRSKSTEKNLWQIRVAKEINWIQLAQTYADKFNISEVYLSREEH